MEAEKNPDYLRGLSAAVSDFRDAFASLMELYEGPYRGPGRALVPAMWPREDADAEELKAGKSRVSVAAGRAVAATDLTNVYIGVDGRQVDPIANWNSVTQAKPLLEPDHITNACDQMVGRLANLIAKAEAEAPPEIGVAHMHELVWGAAKGLWRDGHYRQAVSTAADAVIQHVRSLTGRRDILDTSLYQQVFSSDAPKPGKPRLRWPGDPADKSVESMNDGLRQFAPGVQMTIRNTAAHGQGEITEQEGAERLAALSLLARWVEECKLDEAPDPIRLPDRAPTGT